MDLPAVDVADLQERPVDLERVRRLAASVLRAEGRPEAALSVALVDDARISELHEQFLGDPDPTDVISFPLEDDLDLPGPRLLGEVVVSTDTAAREAAERGLPFEREVLLYVAHGTLHLLGWDDHEDAERERMHARQEELLEAFLTADGAPRA